MDGEIGWEESLARSAEVFDEAGRELSGLVAGLNRLADAAALRQLALGRPEEITSAAVRSIIAARNLRAEYLGVALGEAGWAILLELFALRLEGRQIAMTPLAAASGLPETTAHACVGRMLDQGMLVRRSDQVNTRTALIELSDEAADRMHDYLKAALSLSPWVA